MMVSLNFASLARQHEEFSMEAIKIAMVMALALGGDTPQPAPTPTPIVCPCGPACECGCQETGICSCGTIATAKRIIERRSVPVSAPATYTAGLPTQALWSGSVPRHYPPAAAPPMTRYHVPIPVTLAPQMRPSWTTTAYPAPACRT